MKAAHVKTDGTIVTIELDGLKSFQQAVGGLVEMTGGGDWTAYVNEEGLMMGLPPNPVASNLLGHHIVGDAVFFGGVDDEGVEVDLTDRQLSSLLVGQARQSVLDHFKRTRRTR